MTDMTGPSTSQWTKMLELHSGPLLTWYSSGRVELAGPVLAKWIAKVDNFLASEFTFGESSYSLDLPDCWQKVVWEAALILRDWHPSDPSEADLVVSDNPDTLESAAASGTVTLAQPTDPVGLRWNGAVPLGASDAPGELLAQSDFADQALPSGPLWATENNLLAGVPVPPGRVFLQSVDTRKLLQLWAGGGSAVIIDNWEQDQERTKDILTQEKAVQILT